MEKKDWRAFADKEKDNKEYVSTKNMYVDITGDVLTAILLSRILYWFLPGKTGNSKIRIFKDNKEWIAKKRSDWKNECRISPSQFDRSIKILKKLGLVDTKVYKFAGEPTVHINLDKDFFMETVLPYLEKDNSKGEK